MMFTVRATFGVCLVAFLAVESVFCACQLPSDGTDDPMPDIFKLSKNSYSFIVEANYNHMDTTHYITEYYDKRNMSGKLEMEIGGKKTSIVYFSKTDEYFEIAPYDKTPTKCTTKKLSDLKEKEFEVRFTKFDWINQDTDEKIIGPSNIFRKMFLRVKDKGAKMVKEAKQKVVRGMVSNVWTYCKEDIKVQYSFTDPTQERDLMGLTNVEIPVEITAEGVYDGVQIKESFQFVGMQLDIQQQELDLKIAIPVSIGCQRLAKDLKPIPPESSKGMDAKIEMVYTPFRSNTPSYTYTNNIKLAVDLKDEMTRVELTSWRKHTETEMAKAGDLRNIVVDIGNGFVFDMDKTQGTCKVHRLDDDYDKLNLPDGFQLNMEDDDLFFLGQNSSAYQYLGETIERGIPASVFEKTVVGKLPESADMAIVTRYFTAEDIQVDTSFKVKNSPLRTVVWKLGFEENEFIGKLELNLYDYKNQVPKPHKTYDVTPCFIGEDKSKWFQVVFALDENQMSDILPHIALLQENYKSIVDNMGLDVPPYRIPNLMVDVDKDNVYLTGLILERPDFLLDFIATNETGLKGHKPVGIRTLDGCAKTCIESPDCKSFSYCGALCTIAEDDVDIATDLVKDPGCALYMSFAADGGSVPTMDEISRSIARKVKENKFPLLLYVPGEQSKVLEIPATLFRDNIAFGLNGIEEKPEGTAEPRFTPYKYGYKMDNKVADEGLSLNRLSFGSCQQGCADKDTCQSFSYCQATLECLMSTKHGEEITDDKFVASTQCMTLSRNYRDYFQEFAGLSLNHNAEKTVDAGSPESCAKACYKETGFECKSFDYCPSAPEDKLQSCWLHEEHFSDLKEADIKKSEKCGHYSRKYLLDFKQLWHKDMSTADSGTTISNVTAEDCSKYCRENQGFYCQGFDICFDPMSSSSTCTLRKNVPDSLKDNSICNVYIRDASQVPGAQKSKDEQEGHSKSATGGLAFLMLLIGLALGVGAIYGYGYWRANRRTN